VLAAGLFALTERMLTAPVSLLAASVLEVFKRQAVQNFRRWEIASMRSKRPGPRHSFGPPVYLRIRPGLYAWAFGEPWREAGNFAHPGTAVFLNVASPLSYVFFVAGKQKVELMWQVALFITTITLFLAPLTLKQILWNYTICYSLLYLVYLFMSYRFAKNTGSLHVRAPGSATD
jgi:hypothetical protein